MPTVEQFRSSLAVGDVDAIVERWLLAPGAEHVEISNIEYIRSKLAGCYGVPLGEIEIWITGSAKLGFSISEKRLRDAPTLPRYRKFSAESDIDVAIVSKSIFELIWYDLSLYSHRQSRFPWDSKVLGDYLLCGWLRPDKFPKNVRLHWCDSWWDIFRRLSADPRYGRRRVRGGLFHSIGQLRSYMNRAVDECIATEQLSLERVMNPSGEAS